MASFRRGGQSPVSRPDDDAVVRGVEMGAALRGGAREREADLQVGEGIGRAGVDEAESPVRLAAAVVLGLDEDLAGDEVRPAEAALAGAAPGIRGEPRPFQRGEDRLLGRGPNGLHRRPRPDGQREALFPRREGKSRAGGNGGLFPEHLPADPPLRDLQGGQLAVEKAVHLGGPAEEEGFPRGIARVVADAGGGEKTDRAAPLFIRFAADEGDLDPLRQSRRKIAELRLEGDVIGAAGPVEEGDPRVEPPRCDLPEHRPDRA